MIGAALRRLAGLASRRRGTVFAAALLLSLVALVPIRQLRFDTGILSLLPQDDPAVTTFRDTLELFGSLDLLFVVVRIPAEEPVEPYLDFLDELGPRLEALPEVDSVEYSLGDADQLVADFLSRAFLLLDDDSRDAALARLTDAGIRRRVQELRRRGLTPQSLVARSLFELDPLGLAELLLANLAESRGALRVDWSSGYLVSEDRRMALLIVRPERPAMESEFAGRLLAEVDAAADEVLARWPALAGPDPPPPPVVDLGGTYVTVVDDAENITRDVVTSVGTAMLGVLVLFVLTFRRIGVVGYAFLPLFFGLLLALALAGLLFGDLSAASSGFAALLLGLAIDFVIVSYGRYVEERRAGADLTSAVAAMAGTSGRAVVTGALTTAATFFALGVTDFPGLRQMGTLSGLGILILAAAVLVLLPPILAWSDHRHTRVREQAPDLRLHAFGLGHLVTFSFRRPVLVLTLGAAVTLVAGAAATRLHFETDFRQLRPPGSRGVAVQAEVGRAFGTGFESMLIVVRGETDEELLERVHRAADGARELVARGLLSGSDSLATLLPAPREQAAALQWVKDHSELLDGERVRRVFSAAAREEGLRPEAFARGLDLLAAAAAVDRPIGIGDLASNSQAEKMLRRYVRHDGDRSTALVYLRGDDRAVREAQELVARLGPGFELTGGNVLGEGLRRRIFRDAIVASVVGSLAVALLLYLEYRRLGDTLLSLVPLAIGIVWMFATMVALGISLNFFSIFVSTMIIGIGVDYGIHLVHRYREHAGEPPGEVLFYLRETGRAVVLAALSTTVGFGSLALSHFPAVRSLGVVAILGSLATSLVAITFLPAIFALKCRRRDGSSGRVTG